MNSKTTQIVFGILVFAGMNWAATLASVDGTGQITGTVKVRGVRNSANVIVYLEGRDGAARAPAPDSHHQLMDQKDLTFEPHVLPVVKGSAIDFPNSDKVRHNVYSPAESAHQFNLGTYPAGVVKTVEFAKSGVVPLLCNVHSDMTGFILVLDTPYFATTDKYGRFAIAGVPPGKYLLHAWHEKVKSAEQEVTVEAGKPTTVQIELAGKK